MLCHTCVIYKSYGNFFDPLLNPNRALHNIAGICNEQGNVFDMMLHPERVFYKHTHPDWMRADRKDWRGDGKAVFESVIEYIKKEILKKPI